VQRRARTRLAGAALALAVAGGLTACSGTSGEGGSDTKPGEESAAAEPAPPGKFRTLPEPCGAVSRDTLKQMLPGAAAEAEKAEEGDATGTPPPLDGEAAPTYDTDRRVGCNWQSTTSLGTRRLTVDFERIVSYDPEVSDDEQAGALYTERADEAGVGSGGDAGDQPEPDTATGGATEPSGTPTDGGPTDGGPTDDASKDDEKADDGTGLGSPSPRPSLPPRTLEDIGDDAFIDDRLKTAADGRGSHRDITLVFRTANVLVTVEYSQSIADSRHTPDSAELQEYAQNLARQLAEQFTDS
jgi:hypothetical protein